MPDLRWKKNFEVGNFEIDSEHKIFVKIIQKIKQAKKNRADKDFLMALVLELLKYAEFHFCSEENIMIKSQYPELLKHKKEHEKLLAELRNEIFSLQYEYIDFHTLEAFLIRWFTVHTINEDQKLAAHLRKSE